MKNILKISILSLVALIAMSCGDERKTTRKVQYMADTDMYNAVPYDTYTENPLFENGITAQHPVEGTIARGTSIYDYPNSEVGYQAAKDSLKSPLSGDQINVEKGKKMYNIYCSSCHGKTGDGQGALVQNEKFLGVPNYKDREITEGSIYHVIMHGRNMMGSHASQMTEDERWQVVHYVEGLRAELSK